MKLNKKLELAINAVNALKSKGDVFVRTSDLAVEVGTTTFFLEQIMRNLRTSGIVVVKRGPGGGYSLNKEKSTITAYDVARAVGRLNDGIDLGDTSTANKLRQSIVDAFQKTVI